MYLGLNESINYNRSEQGMGKVIFVGNGINRIQSNYSWLQLLEDLKKEAKVDKEVINGNKPFPILYEEIYFRSKKQYGLKEQQLLDLTVEKMRAMKGNEIHKKIMQIKNVDTIITTNYDYTLETSLVSKFYPISKSKKKAVEKIYRITTCNKVANKYVWHIHGELNYPRSIVLGQNMYTRIIGKIQEYFSCDTFLQEGQSWIDAMFMSEVHMFGFGLDYSELDIWSILNARVRYYHKHKQPNKVFFYLYSFTPDEVMDLETTLESYQIKVVKNKKGEEAKKFYERILSQI